MKNKIKLIIYPIAFSAAFMVLYRTLGFILVRITPYGSYAAVAILVLFALCWIFIALPIYCTIYSKKLVDTKLKFLFVIYNYIVILSTHFLPFNLRREWLIITLFIIWAALWCVLPLACRLLCRKYGEKAKAYFEI